jgi:hypothetical protein
MERECAECSGPFEAKRRTAKYCGGKCRVRATRRRANGGESPEPALLPTDVRGSLPIVEATRRELAAAGRVDSMLGQQALELAARMHSAVDTGSAIASLSRELRAVVSAALADAPVKADPLDELADRRRRKASGG